MANPTFWRLKKPEYDSDYRSTYINGWAKHPLGLPGVKCELCGATWGGSRILSVPCPEAMYERKELNNRWPISGANHLALRADVLKALRQNGHNLENLQPGDCFQPAYLDVPSRPQADFLWASLGSVIVSVRIKRIFEEARFREVAFCPIVLRKVGKRGARLPPLIPPSGDFKDMFLNLDAPTEDIGPYFEMLIAAESAMPPGVEISRCSLCGREEYDKRILVMRPEMWLGHDIFFLATTLWIVVTDKLKAALQQFHVTNVIFERL